MLAVCEYFGVGPEDENSIIQQLGTSEQGTDPSLILALGHKLGLEVLHAGALTLDQLKKYLDKQQPVIVLIQAWYEDEAMYAEGKTDFAANNDGHYVVAIGYDKDKVYFEDPSLKGTRGELKHEEFEQRWHDEGADGRKYDNWGIVFYRKERVEPIKGNRKAKSHNRLVSFLKPHTNGVK